MMGGFFKGWRQKAGCVTLVMACAYLAWWMHFSFLADELPYVAKQNNIVMAHCAAFTFISAFLLFSKPHSIEPTHKKPPEST